MPLRTCLMPLMTVAVILLARNTLPAEPDKLPNIVPANEATPSPGKPAAEPPAKAPAGAPAPVPVPIPVVPKPSSDPGTIVQNQPNFFIHVGVDHANRQYEEGDTLQVSVTSEADAYLHVVYRQADGKVYQIFPNSGQRDNRIQARQTVQIPAPTGLFTWIVGPPFGKESIKVIASREPLGRLSEDQLRNLRFNPVSAKDIEATRVELEQKKEAWTEDQVDITTYARGQMPVPAGGRRFAVLSGVAKYEYNNLLSKRLLEDLKKAGKWKEGDPVPDPWTLPSPENNVEMMNDLFLKIAGVKETRPRINEAVTREGLKASIEWLKEVSRPGDTVFIYHSSHGGRCPDDPADDKLLPPGMKPFYYLLPYDYANLDILDTLAGKKKDGSLDPAAERRFVKMFETAFPDGKVPNPLGKQDLLAVEARLAKEYGVTDVEFGHWIQMLEGRQVVVIMQICHAGGFATREPEGSKGFGDDAANEEFNFLGPALGRLKDIGQPESALLSACSAHETSIGVWLFDEDLEKRIADPKFQVSGQKYSATTYLLIEALKRQSSPLLLDAKLEEWLQQRLKRHCELLAKAFPDSKPGLMRPRLFNYCSRPIVLKP